MSLRRRLRSLAFGGSLATAAALSLLGAAQYRRPAVQPTRVLFIGNSYTYFNNLPELFARLARARRASVETRMVAPGGWRLKDHWQKGDALKTLHEGGWHYVVMQDQSTLGVNYYVEGKPHVTSDDIFKPYAQQWVAEVRRSRAVPVFVITWARKATPEDQAALNYAYIRAAREGRAVIAPVGIAWADVRHRHPAVELFQSDGSHPSPAGSYLAACTLYATIFDRSPVGLPARITGVPVNLQTARAEPERTAVLVDLPPGEARSLQSAAWAVSRHVKRSGGYPKASHVQPPTLPPLPAGLPLSVPKLTGNWRGRLLFYPAGPVDMTLQFGWDGTVWKARLELKYASTDFQDESLELRDLKVGEREITFSNPSSAGVNHLSVSFRGVRINADEIRGIAETIRDTADWPLRMVGTWRLHRK